MGYRQEWSNSPDIFYKTTQQTRGGTRATGQQRNHRLRIPIPPPPTPLNETNEEEKRALKNFASFHGMDFELVDIKTVKNSSAGIKGWAGYTSIPQNNILVKKWNSKVRYRNTIQDGRRLLDDNICYFDIESTGFLSRGGEITTAVVYTKSGPMSFVKDVNLNDLPVALSKFETVVTFWGTGFDIPMYQNQFGTFPVQNHVDLCDLLQEMGLKTRSGKKYGLKEIEEEITGKKGFYKGGLTDTIAPERGPMYQGIAGAYQTL